MFFGSGMSFPGESRGSRKPPANTTKMYEVLEVAKDADLKAIKKAYRKKAMQHHPDKGGDPEIFKELGKAYEILSDPEKRSVYDDYGEEGLEQGAGGGPSGEDIFDMFFGGGRKGASGGKRKGEDVVHPVKVTMEDLYNGRTRKMAINRDVVCPDCDGVGGPEADMKICSACKGQGIRLIVRQMGPMIQQMQTQCNDCDGHGKMMPPDKVCKKCRGEGTTKERKVLEVFIEKGAADGKKLFFRGEADEKPGTIPGDVVFVIQQVEHPTFTRKGNHLTVQKKISLIEALTGFAFELTHLDKRKLIIKSPQNAVTKPGDVKQVTGEGMPTPMNPFVKGNFYVSFSVEFPDTLNSSASAALKPLLPRGLHDPMETAESEIHFLESVTTEQLREEAAKEAYDEDDDKEAGGAQRVQCRQQ